MKTAKEIAVDIFNGDKKAINEIEKMFGKPILEMTDAEKSLGLSMLSAFYGKW